MQENPRPTAGEPGRDHPGEHGGQYTGQVTPGDPSDVRLLPGLALRKVSVGPMDNNAFLLTCRVTGQQLLVDAAADAPRLLRLVEEGAQDGGAGLATVVTTHRHADHTGALAEVLQATGARSAAGELDADSLPVAPDRRLVHGDQVAVGDSLLTVVHLRGHTPGSIALVLTAGDAGVHLFTGDSLFPGGVGNTFGDRVAFEQLLADVEQRLFEPLPDSSWVYPGHGNDTTLGAERPELGRWRERGW